MVMQRTVALALVASLFVAVTAAADPLIIRPLVFEQPTPPAAAAVEAKAPHRTATALKIVGTLLTVTGAAVVVVGMLKHEPNGALMYGGAAMVGGGAAMAIVGIRKETRAKTVAPAIVVGPSSIALHTRLRF